jgi:hypothetical protein
MSNPTTNLKEIGKGEFTTAYLKNAKRVILKSKDAVKECMAHKWFPESYLFPSVDFCDGIENDERGNAFYEMEYFPKKSSIKQNVSSRQWDLYKTLRALFSKHSMVQRGQAPYVKWLDAFNTLPSRFDNEKEALLDAVSALTNYSQEVHFEISPRNVATKGNKLVLLDCFFTR